MPVARLLPVLVFMDFTTVSSFVLPVVAPQPQLLRVPNAAPVQMVDVTSAAPLLLADADIAQTLENFQQSHAFLISILVAILTRYIISEIRARVEKPVMDQAAQKMTEGLTPDTEQIQVGAWAQLVVCILMDLAGDASELIPILGEFTDVAFAPIEAAALFALFKSPLIGGLGFVEEILPFTDVVPTFTISWCLQNVWPTTPFAQKLGIKPKS